MIGNILSTQTRHGRMKTWLLAALLVLLAVPSARTEEKSAAVFYRGKVIRLVVGYGPGGGYDTLARLLAPWLERKTGATVVVENQPGGGGLVAVNRVYRATPDGLTVMLVNGQGATLAQILDIEGARYDLLKTPWLGRVNAEPLIMMLSPKSTFKNIPDILRSDRPIQWGAGGKADAIGDTAACVSEAMGFNARIIIGYKGSKEVALAAMRGEVDGFFTSASSALKYTRGGKLIPVAVIDRKRSPLFPDIPTFFELRQLDEDSSWWLDFPAQVAMIGRALITTPETPPERVDYLREVFREILTDPAVIIEVETKKSLISFFPATELHSLVKKTLAELQGEKLLRVRSVVLEKYYD